MTGNPSIHSLSFTLMYGTIPWLDVDDGYLMFSYAVAVCRVGSIASTEKKMRNTSFHFANFNLITFHDRQQFIWLVSIDSCVHSYLSGAEADGLTRITD